LVDGRKAGLTGRHFEENAVVRIGGLLARPVAGGAGGNREAAEDVDIARGVGCKRLPCDERQLIAAGNVEIDRDSGEAVLPDRLFENERGLAEETSTTVVIIHVAAEKGVAGSVGADGVKLAMRRGGAGAGWERGGYGRKRAAAGRLLAHERIAAVGAGGIDVARVVRGHPVDKVVETVGIWKAIDGRPA